MKKFLIVSGIIAAFVLLAVGICGYLSGKSEYSDWVGGAASTAFITGLFYYFTKDRHEE